MELNKLKNLILGITIFILTMFVTIYGINTFYERPQYEDFCDMQIRMVIESQEECLDVGGKWNPQEIKCVTTPCPQGYCDVTYFCSQAYEDARSEWTKNVFIIAIPLGIVIISVGAFGIGLEPVAAGLMGGGAGTLLYGTWGFFWETNDQIRFVISLVGLAIVIALAYYFNKKLEMKSKKRKKK